MSKQKVLIDDGHARLVADHEPEALGKDLIALTMSDDGGFTSLYMRLSDWDAVKKRMDDWIERIQND